MSLAECVIGVADMMERIAAEWDEVVDDKPSLHLRMFASHLRILVKSHEAPGPVWPVHATAPAMPAELQHAIMIEKAKEEFRKTKQEEQEGKRVVPSVGGVLQGDYVPIDTAMPVGAKTLIAEQVYILQADGKLHFSFEETLALPVPAVAST